MTKNVKEKSNIDYFFVSREEGFFARTGTREQDILFGWRAKKTLCPPLVFSTRNDAAERGSVKTGK